MEKYCTQIYVYAQKKKKWKIPTHIQWNTGKYCAHIKYGEKYILYVYMHVKKKNNQHPHCEKYSMYTYTCMYVKKNEIKMYTYHVYTRKSMSHKDTYTNINRGCI